MYFIEENLQCAFHFPYLIPYIAIIITVSYSEAPSYSSISSLLAVKEAAPRILQASHRAYHRSLLLRTPPGLLKDNPISKAGFMLRRYCFQGDSGTVRREVPISDCFFRDLVPRATSDRITPVSSVPGNKLIPPCGILTIVDSLIF